MALPSMPAVAALSNLNNKNRKVPGVQVKEEKPEDAEITALAAKMVEANKAKMASMSAAAAVPAPRGAMAGNLLNYVSRSGRPAVNQQAPAKTPDKPPFDLASQKGKFGWTLMGEENIPFIFRGEEKYCAVRMVEMKLLAKYLNHLNPDIYTCACIRSYFITENEAKLLSEINMKHSENRFGRETYTTRDLVVRLHDASEFYYFLDLCYNKLINPMSSMKQMCGFIRINGESVVPYAYKDSKQYVPLFYFEGETETLKDKAVTLEGWDLAYLKFCCKVQGIRSELFESDTCVCISLDHIKNYFAGGTVFEEYWPPKIVESSLLLAQKSQRHASWTKAPPPVSPVTSTPSVIVTKEQQVTPAPVRSVSGTTTCQVTNGWTSLIQSQPQQHRYYNSSVSTPAQRPGVNISSLHSTHSSQSHLNSNLSRYGASRMQQIPYSYNPSVSHASVAGSMGSTVHHQPAQPPPLVRVTSTPAGAQIPTATYSTSNIVMQQNNSMQMMSGNLMPPPAMQYSHNNNNNNSTTHNKYAPPPLIPVNGNTAQRYYGAGTDVIDLSSPPQSPQRGSMLSNGNQVKATHVQHRVMEPDHRRSKKLIQISETPSRQHMNHYPFKMQKALVNGKMVPCINAKPYVYSELLMTINDLLDYFFPQVSVSKCREVLQDVLNVDLFSGNLQQKTVLRENNKCKSLNDELPLIQLKDVLTYMPQMTYVMGRMSPAEEDSQTTHTAKRQRVS